MDNFDRAFYALMFAALFCMVGMVFDRVEALFWQKAFMGCISIAMLSMVVSLCCEKTTNR